MRYWNAKYAGIFTIQARVTIIGKLMRERRFQLYQIIGLAPIVTRQSLALWWLKTHD